MTGRAAPGGGRSGGSAGRPGGSGGAGRSSAGRSVAGRSSAGRSDVGRSAPGPRSGASGRASGSGAGTGRGASGRGASAAKAAPAKRGAARGGKPLSEGAQRALERETRRSPTPLSNAARKAVAGRYDRQVTSSDEGRVRAGKRAVRAAERPGSAGGPARRTSDRTLGGEQVEGRQAVRELLLAGRRRAYEIVVATDIDGEHGSVQDIVDLAADQRVPIVEMNYRRFEQMTRSEAPQGVLAKAAPLPEVELDQLLKRRAGHAPFLLAVDGVTDPGNLGALMRSAEGAGVTGVLLPRHRAVHVTPTVAKAAAGAVEYLNVAVVPGLPSALAACRDKGLWVVGLDDAADRSLFDLGDLGAEGIVLVLGAEGAGLSRLVRERCDLIVSIPMRGRIGSLNVSNAGALALYEVTRVRAASASSAPPA